MIDEITMQNICDKFDQSFELEGKPLKKLVDGLLPQIEEIYFNEVYNSSESPTEYIKWLTWMYGKLAHDEGNPEILSEYKKIKDDMDAYAKELASKYKIFSMFDMVSFVSK